MNRPTTVREVVSCLQDAKDKGPGPLALGAGTKPPLWKVDDEVNFIELSGLAGILEYDPSEYVFTALAGTTLLDIGQALEEHGQYMPFDPPLAERGATVGGTTAAGLSGPGRLRYGGLRDFIIGVRCADSRGMIFKGGGRVVKNAAGFDLPKFLAGSLGRLAVLLELTFKVFPKPEAALTMRFDCNSLTDAFDKLTLASRSSWEPDALELERDGSVFFRLSGASAPLRLRAEAILEKLGKGEILDEDEADSYWRKVANFTWNGPDAIYAKVPISPRVVLRLDDALDPLGIERRYGLAGNVAWLSWFNAEDFAKADSVLREFELSGLILRGEASSAAVGLWRDYPIYNRVKAALDPGRRFPVFP